MTVTDGEKEKIRKAIRTLRYYMSTQASYLRVLQIPSIKSTPGFEKFMADYPKDLEELQRCYYLELRAERRARINGIRVSRWHGRGSVEMVLGGGPSANKRIH